MPLTLHLGERQRPSRRANGFVGEVCKPDLLVCFEAPFAQNTAVWPNPVYCHRGTYLSNFGKNRHFPRPGSSFLLHETMSERCKFIEGGS